MTDSTAASRAPSPSRHGRTALVRNWVAAGGPGRDEGAAAPSAGETFGLPEVDIKVRENRLRRMAQRQGLILGKARRRDQRALDYGTYQLVRCTVYGAQCAVSAAELRDGHWRSHERVAGDDQTGYGLSLDDVEAYLTR